MRDRRLTARISIRGYLVLVLLVFVSIGAAGCDTPTYKYNGTTYNSSAEALDALRRDDEAVLAAIAKRDHPIASRISILMPSESFLYADVHVLRCGIFWDGCRTQSSIDEEKMHKSKWQYENLLTTVRAIERSNLFGKVDVEEYANVDRDKIDVSENVVLYFHWGSTDEKAGWYLHTRRNPAGTYVPFDDSIESYGGRVAAWVNALEAFVRPNVQS